jgi:ketosteroid isomerase-like protein
MSQENVAIARGLMDAFFGGDIAGVFARYDPDIEFRPPPEHPDFRVCRGHEEVRQAFTEWIGAWDTLRYDAPDYVDAGDKVLVTSRQRGKAKSSGVEIDTEFFNVLTLRDGKIVRFDMFFDRAEALEAVGLRE